MSSLATVAPVLATEETAAGGGGMFMILLFLLPLLFLFFMMRSQRSRQRKMVQQQQSLEIGDEVMTTTGLYATMVGGDDKVALIEAAPGVQFRWDRRGIVPVPTEPVQPPVEGDDASADEK